MTNSANRAPLYQFLSDLNSLYKEGAGHLHVNMRTGERGDTLADIIHHTVKFAYFNLERDGAIPDEQRFIERALEDLEEVKGALSAACYRVLRSANDTNADTLLAIATNSHDGKRFPVVAPADANENLIHRYLREKAQKAEREQYPAHAMAESLDWEQSQLGGIIKQLDQGEGQREALARQRARH